MKRVKIIISGYVQGVFFRVYVSAMAAQLEITGWVRNEADGTIKIIAEGDEKSLEKFIDACKIGPKFAKVDSVEVKWEQASGEFKRFEIRP